MARRIRLGIIGAGIAGLTLAKAMADSADVRIFEKSRGVGGRMATRRTDAGAFDHGAQYFTIRDERFRAALDTAPADGAIQPWTGAMVTLPEGDPAAQSAADTTRYVGSPSMNALAKAMALGLDIQTDAQVKAIAGSPGQWFLEIGDRREGPFDWLISTAPAPQSASLLPDAFTHHVVLTEVRMNACFTLMIRQTGDAKLAFAAARVNDPVIGWISRNNSKPGLGHEPCLVVNATAQWSDANLEEPLDDVRHSMLEALRRYVPISPVEAEAAVAHRWRYANVERPAGQPFLLDNVSRLAACGDWCIAGRVEAAFLSATALGDALKQIVKAAP
jgi:predicted NAD/FAD-dependent oxidoreductase